MSFGLSPAPEEFQKRIDLALEGLPGQKVIADNILVLGSGDTDEEALKDHDRNLREVLTRCQHKGIELNVDKMQFRKKEVTYRGQSPTGVTPLRETRLARSCYTTLSKLIRNRNNNISRPVSTFYVTRCTPSETWSQRRCT